MNFAVPCLFVVWNPVWLKRKWMSWSRQLFYAFTATVRLNKAHVGQISDICGIYMI